MDSDSAARLIERMNRAKQKGGKAMWPMVMADTLLELFEQSETVTRLELREALFQRRAGTYDKLIDEGCAAAIEALDELPQR